MYQNRVTSKARAVSAIRASSDLSEPSRIRPPESGTGSALGLLGPSSGRPKVLTTPFSIQVVSPAGRPPPEPPPPRPPRPPKPAQGVPGLRGLNGSERKVTPSAKSFSPRRVPPPGLVGSSALVGRAGVEREEQAHQEVGDRLGLEDHGTSVRVVEALHEQITKRKANSESRPRFKMRSAASRQRREDRRSDRPASDSSGNLRPEAQRVRLTTVGSEYGPKRLRPSGPGPKGRIPYPYGSSRRAGFAELGRQPGRNSLNQHGPPEEDSEFAPTDAPCRDVAGNQPDH